MNAYTVKYRVNYSFGEDGRHEVSTTVIAGSEAEAITTFKEAFKEDNTAKFKSITEGIHTYGSDWTIRTENGSYCVTRLDTPSGETYDIMAVLTDDKDMTLINYMFGVTLNSDNTNMEEAIKMVRAYERG